MASVTSLGAPLNIGAVAVRNRICIPPMVLYGAGGPGNQATEAHVAHYRADYPRGHLRQPRGAAFTGAAGNLV